ncbi:MAG: zinc ribbon domain-containing protein [Solirubrobacterales bacterium]
MRLPEHLRRAPTSQTTSQPAASSNGAPPPGLNSAYGEELIVDLERRREQLVAKVAELQWDLGGLVYEMIVRNSIDVEVIVKRAVPLQDADAELSEVERILRTEQTGTAGACTSCGAPHSSGATFCWQCGKPLLAQVSGDEILKR